MNQIGPRNHRVLTVICIWAIWKLGRLVPKLSYYPSRQSPDRRPSVIYQVQFEPTPPRKNNPKIDQVPVWITWCERSDLLRGNNRIAFIRDIPHIIVDFHYGIINFWIVIERRLRIPGQHATPAGHGQCWWKSGSSAGPLIFRNRRSSQDFLTRTRAFGIKKYIFYIDFK